MECILLNGRVAFSYAQYYKYKKENWKKIKKDYLNKIIISIYKYIQTCILYILYARQDVHIK